MSRSRRSAREGRLKRGKASQECGRPDVTRLRRQQDSCVTGSCHLDGEVELCRVDLVRHSDICHPYLVTACEFSHEVHAFADAVVRRANDQVVGTRITAQLLAADLEHDIACLQVCWARGVAHGPPESWHFEELVAVQLHAVRQAFARQTLRDRTQHSVTLALDHCVLAVVRKNAVGRKRPIDLRYLENENEATF